MGVFLTTNNGTSWTAVSTGLTDNLVFSLAVNGTNLFAGTNGGVFLSTNNGTSWTAVNKGLTESFINSLTIKIILFNAEEDTKYSCYIVSKQNKITE